MPITEFQFEPIVAGAAYALDDFSRKTGLSVSAIRAARRRGLVVRCCGKRRYILGDDWLEFLKSSSDSKGARQ